MKSASSPPLAGARRPERRRPARGVPGEAAARLHLEIRGAVQGVGFRPFVHRLAQRERLAGWVINDGGGVRLEVEGPLDAVERFRAAIDVEPPAAAVVQAVDERWLAPTGETGFRIEVSDAASANRVAVLPDLATCPDCLAEIFDPASRRFGYPFTNCTACGPRFTILEEVPWDRARTTMRGFPLCPACRAEYEDPTDRRFHAEPIACPVCGPQLRLLAPDGRPLAERDAALAAAVGALAEGAIVALKGLGGWQLLVDARDEDAVARLRSRKHRPRKPLALMVADLAAARRIARVTSGEADLLAGRAAPIVLLDRLPGGGIAAGVAPGQPCLGVLLPTTPLHHLLLRAVGLPLVATSGNLSEEPIAIDDAEAVERLDGIADLFLGHDRPITRHVDDSVARRFEGSVQVLRRARGYAPLPVLLRDEGPTVLAVGAHQKVVVALARGRQVFLSQHIGDLETPQARAAMERVALDFVRLFAAPPAAVAHDLHPDYPSTRWALAAAAPGGRLARAAHAPSGLAACAVQHHHAHLAAVLAEHGVEGPALGVTWDGTGYGPDGTVWGGELLLGDAAGFERVARLRPFGLPGGEAAVRQPWRVALALLHPIDGALEAGQTSCDPLSAVAPAERRFVLQLLDRHARTPETSSAGRLFDGVAALLGLCLRASWEGEAAVALEALAGDADPWPLPPFEIASRAAPPQLAPGQRPRRELLELDWRPTVAALVAARSHVAASRLAAGFHAALSRAAVEVARRLAAPRVALAGGCFLNRCLTTSLALGLRADGRQVLVPHQVPPGDGGIALGQVAVARAALAGRSREVSPCASVSPADSSK